MPNLSTIKMSDRRKLGPVRQLSLQTDTRRPNLRKQHSVEHLDSIEEHKQGRNFDSAKTNKLSDRPRPIRVAWAESRQSSKDEPITPKSRFGDPVEVKKCKEYKRPVTAKIRTQISVEKESILYTRQELAERLRKAWKDREENKQNLDIFLTPNTQDKLLEEEYEDEYYDKKLDSREEIITKPPKIIQKQKSISSEFNYIPSTTNNRPQDIRTNISVTIPTVIQKDYSQPDSLESKTIEPDSKTSHSQPTSQSALQNSAQSAPQNTPYSVQQSAQQRSLYIAQQTAQQSTQQTAQQSAQQAQHSAQQSAPQAQHYTSLAPTSAPQRTQQNSQHNAPSTLQPTTYTAQQAAQQSTQQRTSQNAALVPQRTGYSTAQRVPSAPSQRSVQSTSNSTPHLAQTTSHSAQNTTNSAQSTTNSAQSTTHSAQSIPHSAQTITHAAQQSSQSAQTTQEPQKPKLIKQTSLINKENEQIIKTLPARPSTAATKRESFQKRTNTAFTGSVTTNTFRPPLARTLSVPVKPDGNKLKFIATKRRLKSARRKGKEEEAQSEDEVDEDGEKILKKGSRCKSAPGGEVVTMVSLISPAESENEEEVKKEVKSRSESPVKSGEQVKAPSLRKTGKSVSFQQSSIHTVRSFSASFPARRSVMSALSSGSASGAMAAEREKRAPVESPSGESRGPKRRLVRAVSVAGEDVRLMNQRSTSLDEDSPQDTRPKTPGSIPENPKQTLGVTRAEILPSKKQDPEKTASESKENEENADENDDPSIPKFESNKERDCWVMYKKMSDKGLPVSYDTILRGMLTPTEYRSVRKEIKSSS